MAKEGFKGQWIQICRIGEFVDASGKRVKIDDAFIDAAVANFSAEEHEPPICIGHPEMDSPAYGWTKELRRNGDRLEARFSDTNDEFEQMVEQGSFKKRSAAFYLSPVSLKHVGFLGAKPPAVKGLRNIQFSDGESVTVEISFSEEHKNMKDEEVDKVADSLWERIRSKFKTPEANAANNTAAFSETDVKQLVSGAVTEAVKTATANVTTQFSEKIEELEAANKTLSEKVNASSVSGKRAEIVSFVEGVIAKTGNHFLRRVGTVEFLEKCATVDAANDDAEFVAFSEGEGDKKVEHKFTMLGWAQNLVSALPPSVQFGEQFGNITATGDITDTPKNLANMNEMREEMGIKTGGSK